MVLAVVVAVSLVLVIVGTQLIRVDYVKIRHTVDLPEVCSGEETAGFRSVSLEMWGPAEDGTMRAILTYPDGSTELALLEPPGPEGFASGWATEGITAFGSDFAGWNCLSAFVGGWSADPRFITSLSVPFWYVSLDWPDLAGPTGLQVMLDGPEEATDLGEPTEIVTLNGVDVRRIVFEDDGIPFPSQEFASMTQEWWVDERSRRLEKQQSTLSLQIGDFIARTEVVERRRPLVAMDLFSTSRLVRLDFSSSR